MNAAVIIVAWQACVEWRGRWFPVWLEVHSREPGKPCLELCPCCVHRFEPRASR